MAPDVTSNASARDSHAAALEAARRRLSLLKAGTLGAGILTFGVLTVGIAGQVSATASVGAAAKSSGQPGSDDRNQEGGALPGDSNGNPYGSGASVNPGGARVPLNPAPGIVSGQS